MHGAFEPAYIFFESACRSDLQTDFYYFKKKSRILSFIKLYDISLTLP